MKDKEQIESSDAWKHISSLSNTGRYYALFGKMMSEAERYFGCSIEEYPFTRMNDIPDDCAMISVTDPFRNVAFIAVLRPKLNQTEQ